MIGQNLKPIELLKKVFLDTTFVDEIPNFSTGEFKGKPNSRSLSTNANLDFELLEENKKYLERNVTKKNLMQVNMQKATRDLKKVSELKKAIKILKLKNRKQSIQKYLWSEASGYYKDYDFVKFRKIRTKKRAISKDEIRRITELNLIDGSPLFHARNYFMFSFYNRGINFIDIAYLKWDNIASNRLEYKRKKTGSVYSFLDGFNFIFVEKIA